MATTPNPTDVFYWTEDASMQYNPISQEGRGARNHPANVIAVKDLEVPTDLDLGDIDPVSGGRIFQIIRKLAARQQVKVFWVLPETNVNYQSAVDAVNKFKVETPE